MSSFEIDFSKIESELLTGRKNGNRARDFFKITESDFYILKSSANQLITSSYFLGLLEVELLKSKNASIALTRVDMKGLSAASKEECEKAIKRGLAKTQSLL
jgi:hypothetical protein